MRNGCRVESFLSFNVLSGWAFEQNSRLGVYYAFRDIEMASKTLGFDGVFQFAEDSSLWQLLESENA